MLLLSLHCKCECTHFCCPYQLLCSAIVSSVSQHDRTIVLYYIPFTFDSKVFLFPSYSYFPFKYQELRAPFTVYLLPFLYVFALHMSISVYWKSLTCSIIFLQFPVYIDRDLSGNPVPKYAFPERWLGRRDRIRMGMKENWMTMFRVQETID